MKLYRLFTGDGSGCRIGIDSVGSGQGCRRTEGATCDDVGAEGRRYGDARPEGWQHVDRVR